MIDPVAAGREANAFGKPYLILDVQPRKLILQAKKHGEMDPPPAQPTFDIREAAPLYVREGGAILACTVMNIKETGPGFVEVELYQTGIVPEGEC